MANYLKKFEPKEFHDLEIKKTALKNYKLPETLVDFLSIDLEKENYRKIVYISHDGDDMHGYILADSFSEFVETISILGAVGLECWQMEVFTNAKTTKLDATCENAELWREFIGVDLEK